MNLTGIWTYLIAGAVGAVLLAAAVFWVFTKGEDAGHSADQKATIDTQRRIDDADSHGPRSPGDADKLLRGDKF